MKKINTAPVFVNLSDGALSGEGVVKSSRNLGDLKGFFRDEKIRAGMDQSTLVYEVEAILPVEQGTEGGLYFGRTTVYPGRVGEEHFMTKGHFHVKSDRSEFYWGIEGDGVLLLMNRERQVTAEKISPGSLHYIPAHTAHRTVNTGNETLVVGACWPSDAGHDYEEIERDGFPASLNEMDGSVYISEI